ncbi:MAG: hypothetical protein KKG59_04115 [Nanoarchaeota archaeon]|nr:hypothetical protein [Nanoarchaeota archaeon]
MGSNVTYSMFFLLLAAVFSTEMIINKDASLTGMSIHEMARTGPMESTVTGNIIAEGAEGASPSIVAWIFIMFLVLTAVLIYYRKHVLKVLKMGIHDSYASFVLRIALGVWFIFSGFRVDVNTTGYVFGIIEVVIGLLLILGLGIRVLGYVLTFYSATLLANPSINQLSVLLMIGISLALAVLGGGRYSFDNEYKLHRKKRAR